MTSTRAERLTSLGRPDENPSPGSGSTHCPSTPEHERVSSIVRPDLERMTADLEANQRSFVDARRNKNFKEAATYHKRIIGLRKDLVPIRQFSLASEIEANLIQAALLLNSEDVNSSDHSIFPETVCEREGLPTAAHTLAWSLLAAKIGFLHMRSNNMRDLEMARTFLETAMNGLLRVRPPPTEHLFPIAQCVADLYDVASRDVASAHGMVGWLSQQTGTSFENISVGRISSAIDWATNHGFEYRSHGFDVSVMEQAIKQNEPKILETMLIFTERTRPSSHLPSKLLLTAADTRNMTICQLLFEHRANVAALDEGGKTVLHRCLYSRDSAKDSQSKREGLKIAGFFLSKDSTLLNKQDHSGKTALYVACEVGYTEMVAFLVESQANVNLTENNAQTPLYMACERGRRHVVKCLLDRAKDVEIDAKGPGGQTALIVAVQHAAAHAEGKYIVDMLLRKGADPLVHDNTGKTAINYVGGIWASDLKSALKNAKPKSVTSPVLSKVHEIPSSVRSSLDMDRAQRTSRPPSTRTSMFAKIMQPRGLKSGNSSLFSPSRTSLETTTSRAPASIFSTNDMSSRRTSITTPSIMEYDGANELEASSTKGDLGKPLSMVSRRSSVVDHERAQWNTDASPRPNLPSGTPQDLRADKQPLDRPASINPSNAALPIRTSQDTRGSTESYHSSTESGYDTPSDSEVASHDGDHRLLESRMHNLSLHTDSSGIRQRPGDQDQQGGTYDGSSSIPTPPSDLTGGGGGGGKKRRLNSQNDAEGGRGGKVSSAAQGSGSDQKRQVLLACPFAKKDPIAYEHCHSYDLREIKHVKQHLKRCHLIVYCARCRQRYASQVALERHHRDDHACARSEREVPEGMTLEQHETLKPRTNHKLSLENQWYFIWDVLFPGQARPATPYKDEFVNMTEFHRFFTVFMENQIPTLATRVLEEMGNVTAPMVHDQAVSIMRRGLREFASGLHNSGLIGQNGNLVNEDRQSRSGSVAETAEPSPTCRLGSFGDGFGRSTPDSGGLPAFQQNSPATTGLSHDDQYEPLQPIREASSDASSYRQESVGAHSESGRKISQAQPGSSLTMPPDVPYQNTEWDTPNYMQAPNPAPGALFGVGTGWNEPVEFGNPNNILYSPANLFNMDTNAIDQLEFQVGINVFDSPPGGVQVPVTGSGYFPPQMQGQQGSFVPFMGGGQAPAPFSRGPPNIEAHPGFSPTPRQPDDGREPPWGI